jgi:hypothetical protein
MNNSSFDDWSVQVASSHKAFGVRSPKAVAGYLIFAARAISSAGDGFIATRKVTALDKTTGSAARP